MFEMALRNVVRQKTRTALTIIGIMVGIGAIVALGSISEGLRVQITEGLEQASGLITITERSNSGMFIANMLTSRLSEETVNEIMNIDGVKEAAPIIYRMTGPEDSVSFTNTFFEVGVEPEKMDLYISEIAELDEGEELEEGDTDYAVIGSEVAERLGLEAGDTITIEDMDFQVKGVYEEVGNREMDSMILFPLEAAKDVFDTDEYSAVIVYPEDIDEVEELTKDIEDNVEGVSAFTTAELAKQMEQIIDQISFFTIGIAAISTIVGGLGVMNTMIMSVMERRREIGVLKAIGATNGYVLKMILIESVIISLIGGLLGLGIGYIGSSALGFISQGQAEGIVTPRLAIYSMAYALLLGAVGGLYPARKASQLSPVEALRYE